LSLNLHPSPTWKSCDLLPGFPFMFLFIFHFLLSSHSYPSKSPIVSYLPPFCSFSLSSLIFLFYRNNAYEANALLKSENKMNKYHIATNYRTLMLKSNACHYRFFMYT
jgi:hypothetical protein